THRTHVRWLAILHPCCLVHQSINDAAYALMRIFFIAAKLLRAVRHCRFPLPAIHLRRSSRVIFNFHELTCMDWKIAEGSYATKGCAQPDDYARLCASMRITDLNAHRSPRHLLKKGTVESFNRDSKRSARRATDTRSSPDIPAKIGWPRLSGMSCESRLNDARRHHLTQDKDFHKS